MPDAAREIFVTGLKNAHAMENQALSIMKPQLERLEHYPEMASRIRDHIAETEAQAQRLDRILADVGEGASSLKDTFLSAFGGMASLGHATAGDEVLKNAFANHAFENYEIAPTPRSSPAPRRAARPAPHRSSRRTSTRNAEWPNGSPRTCRS